jgi:hypothetical protein
MTYNNNSYYEAPYDDQAEHEHLQAEIDDLLKYDPDFDCTNTVAFGEAIQQTSDENQKIIRDYIEQKDWAKLGLKLYTISLEYQESNAEYHLTK